MQFQKNYQRKKMKHLELMYHLITLVKLTGTNNLHYSKYGATLVSCGATTGYDAKTDLTTCIL